VLLLADRRFVTPKSIKECCLSNEGHTVGDSVTIFNSWDTLTKQLDPNAVHSPEWVH